MHHSQLLSRPDRIRTSRQALRTGTVCAALSLTLLVLVAARWSPLMSLDRTVADALHRRAVTEPGLVHVNRVLTDWLWDPWTMRALIAVAVVALWWRGARPLAGWVAATSLFSSLLQQGIKAAVGRERPQWSDPVDSAHYAAFPSGHALTAMVSCGLLLWLLQPARRRTPDVAGGPGGGVGLGARGGCHPALPGRALAVRCAGRVAAGGRAGRVRGRGIRTVRVA